MSTFEQVVNFRDFGGCPTADGGRVRRGVLYRSAHFGEATEGDIALLERLGVSLVIDFRGPSDKEQEGHNRLPAGVRELLIPMYDPARGNDPRIVLYSAAARRSGAGLSAGSRFRGDGRRRPSRSLPTPNECASTARCCGPSSTPTDRRSSFIVRRARTARDGARRSCTSRSAYRVTTSSPTTCCPTRIGATARSASKSSSAPASTPNCWRRSSACTRTTSTRASIAVDRHYGGVEQYLRDGLGIDDESIRSVPRRDDRTMRVAQRRHRLVVGGRAPARCSARRRSTPRVAAICRRSSVPTRRASKAIRRITSFGWPPPATARSPVPGSTTRATCGCVRHCASLADTHRRRFELQSFAVGGARMADVFRDQLDPLISSRPDIAVVVVGTNDAIRFTPLGDVTRVVRSPRRPPRRRSARTC